MPSNACSTDANYFFGHYLVAQQIIQQDDLDQALAMQAESNRRIGGLAVDKGYLSGQQAEDILREQRVSDQPFGAIALQRGWLSVDQLDELLFFQTVHSTCLGEALMATGCLKPDDFSKHLAEFQRQEQERGEELQYMLSRLSDSPVVQAAIHAITNTYLRFLGQTMKVFSVCCSLESLNEHEEHRIQLVTPETGCIESVINLPVKHAEQLRERLRQGGPEDPLGLIAAQDGVDWVLERYLRSALTRAGYAPDEDDEAADLWACDFTDDKGVTCSLAVPGGLVGVRVHVQASQERDPCEVLIAE